MRYGEHPEKHQIPIMSGKQSPSMTTSIRSDVRTSKKTNGRCQDRTKEQSKRTIAKCCFQDEADSYIAKTNATLLDCGEVWQCQMECSTGSVNL